MPHTPSHFLQFGSWEPPARSVSLTAGPLSLVYEAGDLRDIRFGTVEIANRLYAAVRDAHWGTIPCRLQNEFIEVHAGSFRISYLAVHRKCDVHFEWQGEILGESDGTIRFDFRGEAKSSFLRNRIGFCLLHPMDRCAGLQCRVIRQDGSSVRARFPSAVAPEQPLAGFANLRGLSYSAGKGARAHFDFAGDVFEMEDQRNWIDASFKTYCTPLALPFPVWVEKGQRIGQTVVLKLTKTGCTPAPLQRGRTMKSRRSPDEEVVLTVKVQGVGLPPIGLGMASHGEQLPLPQEQRLRSLGLSHLRADLDLSDAGWRPRLELAMEQSEDLNVSLELALALGLKHAGELRELARQLGRTRPDVVRWIVTDPSQRASGEAEVALARKHLGSLFPLSQFGAGTNSDFYQLNQVRPSFRGVDFVSFSMNPQVHAFDLRSLAETPEAVPASILTARKIFGGLPVVISPVTLKPRFNPVAAGPESPPPRGELPAAVDPRQMSLFGAGWTLAMLRQLIASRVASATLFETTGWRGLMEKSAGSPLPEQFPSKEGMVYPLYFVFAFLVAYRQGVHLATHSTAPVEVQGLALRSGRRTGLLLANLSTQPRRLAIRGFASRASALGLDAASVLSAMLHPDSWRICSNQASTLRSIRGHLRVDLAPGALLQLNSEP